MRASISSSRCAILVAILAAALVLLSACGGGGAQKSKLAGTTTLPSGQREYHVRLPNGQVVIQAHSPELAEPHKGLALPRAVTGGVVEQWDSTEVGTVPRAAYYVAGYVNGRWPTYWQMRGNWPVVTGIAVSSSAGADCLDMEPGNPGPGSAGPWARWQFTQGNARPCEYSMLSWMGAIRSNLSAYGIPVCYSAAASRCVRLWDANWTYRQHLDSGYGCTQWTDHSFGRNLDESSCAGWFFRASPPPPKPKPDPYAIFPRGPFPSPYGDLDERLTVQQFDGAYAHRGKYRAYLRGALHAKLLFLADRAAYVALDLHHGWGRDGLGVRFQVLIHDAQKASRA